MHKTPYPVAPEQWATTPIRRGTNSLTGRIEGDDSGYRKVRTLPENVAPLVVPAVLIRASYDGTDEYGSADPSITLAGGLNDDKLVVRENVARELEDANRLLVALTGGEYEVCALDGFRSWKRQAAGFTRMLLEELANGGLTDASCLSDPLQFLFAANTADGTFSFVNADTSSPQYAQALRQIEANPAITDAAHAFAAEQTRRDPDNPVSYDDAVFIYITACVNAGIGGLPVMPLVFENNAHAGGGAVDLMLVNRSGRPVSLVPFDFPGDEAGMDYQEKDENYNRFMARLGDKDKKAGMLRRHLERLGYMPQTFTHREWELMRDINRIRYHLGKAKGWTYYSSEHGGENWHFEPGNIGYDARKGTVVCVETETATTYPDSGNPGHALQVHGRDAIAVWGGNSGHRLARVIGLEE